ncbi:ataxin-3 [Cryptococcus wingfieldii CBS 7118]|uniref:ubiquitinyl hydrolase 1 n=1 Tax=Cryptococcus wingfieldii CBS 7118 TaxID=1295528 RepID=A0A1E3J2V9_9TREE|nr:ataxin-3 [Cryptococcus wingfieldii CBS 7118]ODN95187.1 ataxin-3 [Cryptococcus wingfieldii CBS 7118]
MDLVPYMFYEKQEPGSQLCAQHCLNNLLQQHSFDEFGLADVAKELDEAENAKLSVDYRNKKSYNFDDSGYFSISVLERALDVFDLAMVRWRGEAMKAYQEHPEQQVGFILNLASHWFPLRRFAPNPPHAVAIKRWYNLNSFLPNGPEWISPTYLRMVLTQAEEEGYSVFVIRKNSPGGQDSEEPLTGEGAGWADGGIGVLPECLADTMAVTLGEPVGRSGPSSGRSGTIRTGGTDSNQVNGDPNVQPSAGPSSPPARGSGRRRRQPDLSSDGIEPIDDPFSAPPPASRSRQTSSRSQTVQGDGDLFDNVHGVLQEPTNARPDPISIDDSDEQEDEDEELDDDFEMLGAGGAGTYRGPTDFQQHARSYDDEDAALQAALKASMADVPQGWELPDVWKEEKSGTRSGTGGSAPSLATPADSAPAPAHEPAQNWSVRDSEAAPAAQEEKNEVEDDDGDEPAEEVSPEEIRRRRLARFG